MHALGHTGAECHFMVWSCMLVVLIVSILGRLVLAVEDVGVVFNDIPYVLSCRQKLQQRCEGERHPVGKLPFECCS
ncbi:hypothetical protein TNCV_4153831 [Trichonephila clavipes]|nr:hypothetical protein TNCV_4153831 [Trichonephila clavipes]